MPSSSHSRPRSKSVSGGTPIGLFFPRRLKRRSNRDSSPLAFSRLDLNAGAEAALNPGITWFGWTVPTTLSVFMIFALGLAMLAVAIWEFNAGE